MRFDCEFSTSVARTDLDDYIRHLEISVGCFDEDALNEYIVGKLAVDRILWADAITDGVSLFDICDSDSRATSCSCTVPCFIRRSIHTARAQDVVDAEVEGYVV
jgi:hypothetical protein